MAGVTTAARMAFGAVTSSEAMNPQKDWSHFVSLEATSYQGVYNLPQTHKHLRIFAHNSQQSNWYGTGYFNFNSGSGSGSTPSNTAGSYSYFNDGWSQGDSANYTTNSSTTIYDGTGFSNYGHLITIDIYNYASSTVIKAWRYQSTSSNANQTSYPSSGAGGGYLQAGQPITNFNMYTNYGNGNSGYNRISVYGWGGLV
tara:strand:+ start:196 stop:792 length:597 start_codon:yes stop_codon:yes gene_type:complete